jgi:5'(3')-deoxyribonucleotidase
MRKILYIDMDNVLVDFRSAFPRVPPDILRAHDGRLDEVPGIFALMDPLPGALEAHAELSVLFDTYILSTAPWENPSAWSDKLAWVKRYLGTAGRKRLILSHYKNLNKGHFLVDDRINNGAGEFEGKHIHFGTPAFPNWQTVTAYLRSAA